MIIKYKKLLCIILMIICFKLGYEAKKERVFPVGQWYEHNFGKEEIKIELPSVVTNVFDRQQVDCPNEKDSVVIVGFGQSNSANHAGQKYESKDDSVLNFYNGNCYLARDPLLGATGVAGSLWIPMANKIAKKIRKKIILVTFGVGGASIKRWDDDKDLGLFYMKNVESLKLKYKSVSYFLWIQGESDKGMNAEDYGNKLKRLINKTKHDFPGSKFMLSATTYCLGRNDIQINLTQKQIAQAMPDVIFMGDTDQYADLRFRYDDCHLSGQGVDVITSLFAKSF